MNGKPPNGTVTAVSLGRKHAFTKLSQPSIRLIADLGVEGDAHAGTTVQHRYDKWRHPGRANLRQVHLMHEELFAQLRERGFDVAPGQLGENITTSGIDLLHLGRGTILTIGTARLRLTGLRTPCSQIDTFQPGLMRELIADKRAKAFLSGVMSVVIEGGHVRAGDAIGISGAGEPFEPLTPV